jgi:hypothetical protein
MLAAREFGWDCPGCGAADELTIACRELGIDLTPRDLRGDTR